MEDMLDGTSTGLLRLPDKTYNMSVATQITETPHERPSDSHRPLAENVIIASPSYEQS